MLQKTEPVDRLTEVLDKAVGSRIDHRSAASSGTIPAPTDVRETDVEVVVFVDLPGVDEDDIEIERDEHALLIRTVREFDHDQEDAEEYTRLERPYGEFETRVEIPLGADFDGMTAKYRRGVLKVRIPRTRAHRMGVGVA